MFRLFKNSNNTPDLKQPESGIISKLVRGLQKTQQMLTGRFTAIFAGKTTLDRETLVALEEQLLMADVGVTVTQRIIEHLKRCLVTAPNVTPEAVSQLVREQLEAILAPWSQPLEFPKNQGPKVILVVGINGAGKTTTIGKLAYKLQQAGQQVLLAAGDTYRAAAIEQLKLWGDRNGVPVIAQRQGADSASVLYDAFQAAKSRKVDILLADTAGRLHTQAHLMEELKKIKRILQKLDPEAPHETLLVLDATIGQNALNQARQFKDAIGVTGLCLTKLDGTAKGGVIFAVAQETQLPIRFIGVGEALEDLQTFNAQEFVEALFTK